MSKNLEIGLTDRREALDGPAAGPASGEIDLHRLADTLDAALSQEGDIVARLRMIAKSVRGRIAFSTSLGLEDQALLHAISESGIACDIFMLDTGRHFIETLDVLDRSNLRYRRSAGTIRVVAPDASDAEELVQRDGVFGFRASIAARKACCDVRKVRPLNRSLAGAAAWLTGLRRSQSAGRAQVPFAEFDRGLRLIKINPLADWSLDWLDAYVGQHGIPINDLHAKGYPSIGCAPCTRAIEPGEDIRAGRWWWEQEDGKECGLHTAGEPIGGGTGQPNRPAFTTNARPERLERGTS